MIIEMNLCVFRFFVLVFKVIGFLIVKMVVKFVVGCIFDGISNDITFKTSASFESSIDYVIIKIF